MSPLSQLLQRNAERISALRNETLLFNPPADLPLAAPQLTQDLQVFTQDYVAWEQLTAAQTRAEFSAFPKLSAPLASAVLFLAKEKQRNRMHIHYLADRLGADGELIVAGENAAGAKSAGKLLEPYFAQVKKVDSARHCSLYQATATRSAKPFQLEDYLHWEEITIADQSLQLALIPGVFASRGLDPGTQLLLEHLPEQISGNRLLDFGCGNGVIAASLMKKHALLDVTMLDSNALALEAAQRTLQANGLRAHIKASNGLSAASGHYDLIVSNPPFHAGLKEDKTLSMRLLAQVRNFLSPQGQLLMVVNRHLPYAAWMDRLFGRHQLLAQNSLYNVLSNVDS